MKQPKARTPRPRLVAEVSHAKTAAGAPAMLFDLDEVEIRLAE